jgi:hypothetical protein
LKFSNRLVFGNKFDAVFPSHRPATFMRLQAGGTISSSSRNVSAANYPGIAYRDQTVGTLSLMRVPRRIGFRSGGRR